MEAEVLIQSLGLNLLCLISIDNLPSLIGLSVSLIKNNISVFFIFSSTDIKDSVILNVGNEFTFIDEQLPPS